jgi:hypothetical protein
MYRKQHLEIFGPDGHFLTLDEILNRAVRAVFDRYESFRGFHRA